MYLNDLCERLGMDTITAGNLFGSAIEDARRERCDYVFDYGQLDAVVLLLHMIAYRLGVGNLLAQGGISYCQGMGSGGNCCPCEGPGTGWLRYPRSQRVERGRLSLMS